MGTCSSLTFSRYVGDLLGLWAWPLLMVALIASAGAAYLIWGGRQRIARHWTSLVAAPAVTLLAVGAFALWAMRCDAAQIGFRVDWAGVAVIAAVGALAALLVAAILVALRRHNGGRSECASGAGRSEERNRRTV